MTLGSSSFVEKRGPDSGKRAFISHLIANLIAEN
jgi:hypothetical protein